MDSKIIMPWEERPEGCSDVMWRYSKNPVIGRYHIPSSNSIFNSAVVPFGDGFAGVFRCDNKSVQMNIFAGFSKDGINWEINHESPGLKIVIGLLGAMVTTDLQLVSVIHSTSKNSSSAKMPSCLLTAMGYFFRRR